MAQPFIEAVRKGDAAQVRALLAADPGLAAARDEKNVSAVLNARYYRQEAILDLLVEAGAPLDLWEAAVTGRTKRVAELLDGDASLSKAYSGDGFAPLHAAYFAPPEVIELLLARGADANAQSRNAMALRPLHSAASTGNPRNVELLLKAGADPNARQHGGWTPIHAAAQAGNEPVVKLLLSYGADPAAANESGQTALGLAKEKNHAGVVKLLESAVAKAGA